jgi:outer membrane protein OmpA-like peptidoglycan-associated protein/tetratricopeptide (TPR) repeat protein
MISKLTLIIVFIFLCLNLSAQEKYSTKSKRAIKHFETAVDYYNKRIDEKALEEIEIALGLDNGFVEAYLLKANIYGESKKTNDELQCYLKVIEVKPDYSANIYFFAGECELKMADYNAAKQHFQKCLEFDVIQPVIEEMANDKLKRAEYGIVAKENPVPFNPVNSGENINSKYDEYWPSLSADEQTLVLTRLVPVDDRFPISEKNRQEDFYLSYRMNGDWSKANSVGRPLNTLDNEGAQSLSADGQYMYFAACNRPDGYGSCDIYFSEKIRNSWSKPFNIGPPVNTEAWESSPCISSDGKTLYFASSRRGGKGDIDIWKSELNDNGTWSDPKNLGDSINTSGKDLSPFIHQDNSTLYFTSDMWIGLGGYDIFLARKKRDGTWTTPVNLGYPINSEKNEIGLIVNAKGNLAMFSSDKTDGNGKDIFQFELYDQVRPLVVTYVKGIVFDSETKKPLKAKFELINLESSEVIIQSFSNEISGEYLVCLPVNQNYALNVSKEGYLFYSANFSLKNLSDPSKPYKLDVPLQPVQVGKTVILKNIFFDTDLYSLKPESIAELDKLVDFLKMNSSLKIEISGHTDNAGTNEHNTLLSQNRAKSVYEYLISKSIKKERLSYAGYSFSKPIDTNDTELGRANNRRTEFKIISVR